MKNTRGAFLLGILAVSLQIVSGAEVMAQALDPMDYPNIHVEKGELPHACTAEEFAEGLSVNDPSIGSDGKRPGSHRYNPAPYCYPVWGFLAASAPGKVKAGKPFTVTAIPKDGSNSAVYAVSESDIVWEYPGTLVSGCGPSDLTCTVIPAKRAKKYWQWSMFKVSMPRTYFIDSPGSFCVGIHACPGVTTQAWSFVGVPPKKKKKKH